MKRTGATEDVETGAQALHTAGGVRGVECRVQGVECVVRGCVVWGVGCEMARLLGRYSGSSPHQTGPMRGTIPL